MVSLYVLIGKLTVTKVVDIIAALWKNILNYAMLIERQFADAVNTLYYKTVIFLPLPGYASGLSTRRNHNVLAINYGRRLSWKL